MPSLRISTNVPCDDPLSVAKALSAAVAKALGKPESYVMVELNVKQCVIYGGSDAPAATGSLLSIGAIDLQTNTAASGAVCEILKNMLGVPSERVYIEFFDVPRQNLGWKGKTFAS